MRRTLPPLDLHAHINPDAPPRQLEALGAVVFAATRSLDEFERTLPRSDAVTVWGLGVHPGVRDAQEEFDSVRLARLLKRTPLLSEVGLDGASRVPLEPQIEVLHSILTLAAQTARIVSVHSRRATSQVLDIVESTDASGIVLHWWLGTKDETRRAIELGCLFSANRSMDLARLRSYGVPLERLLPETDHPMGNRGSSGLRQPGWVGDVEELVASVYQTTPAAAREQFWRTLVRLVDQQGVDFLLTPVMRSMTAHVRSQSWSA